MEKQSSSPMMVLSVYSPDGRYDVDLHRQLHAALRGRGAEARPGANRTSVFGLPDIAMRVWLQPDRMAQLGIRRREVAQAIQSQNQTFGIGQIGAPPARARHAADLRHHRAGLLTEPEDFEDIIVRTAQQGTAIVRVRDIGRVELAKMDYWCPA